VQLIAQILELIPAEIAGWMAVVAGFAAFALLLRLDQARKDSHNVLVIPPQPAGELEPGRDWQKIMDVSLVELDRAPDLRSMQAEAARQVDAAEHAFNRMLAECAKVTSLVVAPTFEPLRQLVREPAPVPAQHQPLAA
jgi:hypothetical protein